MIVTRTPLRISIAGGGTDLPSYYSRLGSFFISAAINKYVYITFYRTFIEGIRLKYSRMEEVGGVDEISHAIVRETFRLHGVTNNAEMASHADVPGGTGLGSSGSFGVGLSHALYVSEKKALTSYELAEEATKVQMDILGYPIGLQDQYAAAFGGFNGYAIAKDGTVTVEPIKISKENLQLLKERLVMLFTGISRSASDILVEQKRKSDVDDEAMVEALHEIQKLGHETKEVLEGGNLKKYGEIMRTHWEAKKKRSAKMTTPRVNYWYEVGLKNGAIGGKLVGAGGGGFLLFYTEDREKLIAVMEKEGLRNMDFAFDFEGSRVLVNE